MENNINRQKITVETAVNKPLDQVWDKWTAVEHIVSWNAASSDWYTPSAINDLRVGGTFNYRMEARDGSAGFDFSGIYDAVIPYKNIAYTLGDGRKVDISFIESGGHVQIKETFEAEDTFPPEMQRSGWQSILDHFKSYTEL